MSKENSFLNEVDITSKIRAPGEHKYYYCGENNSESDKSFLVVSSMWYTDKITEDMEIQASCYNFNNTAQIFLNIKTNIYNIFIYQNIIDYHNENMTLKLTQQINLPSKYKLEGINNRNEIDKTTVKIFFVSNNYILFNEIDYRIILIEIKSGNFITIFNKTSEEKEPLYNIIDIYDESYMTNGEQRIRTYVFLSKKNQERKTPTYSYKYFIVQRDVFKMKTFFLHNIDFDLGNSEPIGLKIGKIVKPDCNGQKFMYILIFMSTSSILQLITDYDNVTLHQMLKKHSRANNTHKNIDEDNENINESNEENSSNEEKNSLENINPSNEEGFLKTKHWITKRNVESEKKQFNQSIKIALNINNKKACSFILFFESKKIVSYLFNYSDTPEEIKDKIFINSNINLRLDERSFEQTFKNPAKIFKFLDIYLFRCKSFFGYSNNNLIVGDKNKIHIYSENEQFPIYTYEFYNETLSSLFSFEGLGSTFLLTGTKLFKIIFDTRYNLFSNEKVFKNDKIFIHDYKYEKKMGFPVFEYKPEDIWNSYCVCLGIQPVIIPKKDLRKTNSRKILSTLSTLDNNETTLNEEEEEDYEEEYFNFQQRKTNDSHANANEEKICSLCGKISEKYCSDCKMRFYCCNEHFLYDYYSYHFFECQLIQFFKRRDIISIYDKEIRYKVLYNELIKVAGRILSFIFKRIYSRNDYQYFLKMILTLIDIMNNFGFGFNLSDFCSSNYCSNEKKKNKLEKIIFYQEALFFYVQLNLLKCTFALKSGLYNLTDCYLKIIKNDIIPLLTPKMSKRLISLKCERPKTELIYNNDYFNEFNRELFFDITKYQKNCCSLYSIDLVEEYIIKHLMSLSLLVKFKKKINSTIEVQNSFVDINLMFDDHYNESGYKNIVSYCYFFVSFYLVEIGKVPQTVKLYKRMINQFFNSENNNNKLKALTNYNLGLLQYALGYFDIGIHNIELAYKLIVQNNFSDKIRFKVIDSLGLAYLNIRNLFKAYILLQTSLQERKKIDKKKNEIICTKLNVYLNYIIDLYEYTFISKSRFLIKKKYKNLDKRQLLKFVLGEDDKELVISEQNLNQFIKVVEFIWNLPDNVLKQLNADNPPKAPTNSREDHQHDRNLSFNSDVSMTSTFINKENGIEKDDLVEEYEEDIEVKTTLYDSLLSRKQQQDFKELKTIYLKRDIILRDSLGDIEKFNINYEPIYAKEFQKIIEKLKSNFLLKEIFYCFQNEKWRDELYNYNQNNILFGLSKYLKLEKIQNMMAIEKTKIIEIMKMEKLKKKNLGDLDTNLKIDTIKSDYNKNVNKDFLANDGIIEEENEVEIPFGSLNSNSFVVSDKKDKNVENEANIDYQKFKEKFITALKELEKDKKNEDFYEFLNFDEDYLYNLYINVFKDNPDHEFIFENPLLILNYIFIDINKTTDKEKKKSYIDQALNISKIKEEKRSFQSSQSIKKEENEEKNDKKDQKEKEDILSKSSSSYESSLLDEKSNNDSINSKNKDEDSEKNNSNEENLELNRKNTLTKKFLFAQSRYNDIDDKIDITDEISFTIICEKKPIKEPTIPVHTASSRKNTTKRKTKEKEKDKEKNNLESSKGLIISLYPDHRNSKDIERDKERHKTFIDEAEKIYFLNKDLSNQNEMEKTFAIIQKNNRLRKEDKDDKKKSNEILNRFSFSPIEKATTKKRTVGGDEIDYESKNKVNNDNFNYLKNRKLNYIPFINKDKNDSKIQTKQKKNLNRNKNKQNNLKNKKENDQYFDLAKEINKYDNQKNKKRAKSIEEKFNEKESNKNMKKKDLKIELNLSSDKFSDENDNSYNDIRVPKKKNKNQSYRFKTKEEREKEIEIGAIKYLQNDYKNKSKNKLDNQKESKFKGKGQTSLTKKIYNKSVVPKITGNNFEYEKYLEKSRYLNEIKYKNGKRNTKDKKANKNNSNTTKNTSSNEYYKKFLNNDSLSIVSSNVNNKNNDNSVFQNEFKKIIKFNKKLRKDSQDISDNKNSIKYKNQLNIKTEENKYNDNDESAPIFTDCQYNKYKEYGYHRNINSMPKKYINTNIKYCPENEQKQNFNKYNPNRKYNVIPSTNYTNTESPKNTFHGKQNNNSRLKVYSRELNKKNNKYK